MDKELFRKTEGKLYRYYKNKNEIYKIENKIRSLENIKRNIEDDIKNANVIIDYYKNGIGIQERVQTSASGSSYAEQELCRAITKLEDEHVKVAKKILKNKAKIRHIEEFIKYMDDNIGQLTEEDKRFIELKYGDGKNPTQISMILNMAQATAYRKREEVVKAVAEYENTFLFKI
ncbi:transcriptional regulator [Clostridium sp.]|uniref:transcriptional regulator n=1 Tax=Clostridium sp. TaxID=1506 RepID=UPI001D274CB5|nr:transcriptional regulator [Clostridium sp.]MBS5306458.1 transcriptional regulator [Clostridium sp.]